MGKPKIRPPQNLIPDLIEINFGTVDFVGELTPHAKFHVNLHKGGVRQIGEIYAKNFIAIYLFSQTHLQVRPCGGFLRAITQTTRSRARMCLFGIKKFEVNI